MQSRQRKVFFGVVIVAFLFGVLWIRSELLYREYMADVRAFRELASLEQQMLEEGATGTISCRAGLRRVVSFADFYKYVVSKRLGAVSSLNAPNPFPGILPGDKYETKVGSTTHSDDRIIYSRRIYKRPSGAVRLSLTAAGNALQDDPTVVGKW